MLKKNNHNVINYENKIIIWLDILGFENAINETTKQKEGPPKYTVCQLKEMFTGIDEIVDSYLDSSQVVRFSDTIVIVAPPKHNGNLFTAIKKIHLLLLNYELLLRGSIISDNVYFETNTEEK